MSAGRAPAPPSGTVPAQWTAFVDHFAAGWADPQVDEFVARFRPLFADDALLVQPMSPEAHGPDGLEKLFRGFFTLFPEIKSEIVRWGAGTDAVFIEMEMTLKIGRRVIKLRTSDHVIFDADGKVAERRAFLDPLPLIGAIVRSPSVWPRLLKAR